MDLRRRTIRSGSFYAGYARSACFTITVNYSGMRQRRIYDYIAEQQRTPGRLIRYSDRFGDASANCVRLLRQALDLEEAHSTTRSSVLRGKGWPSAADYSLNPKVRDCKRAAFTPRGHLMSDTALSVLVNALNRPVHFPKLDQTGCSLHRGAADAVRVAETRKWRRTIGRSWRRRSSSSRRLQRSARARWRDNCRRRSRSPILDLAKVPVSAGSLHTLLADLEAADKSDPIAAFHEGRIPVIVDALDEGRLLSNETGIEQFLGSTAELIAEQPNVLPHGPSWSSWEGSS